MSDRRRDPPRGAVVNPTSASDDPRGEATDTRPTPPAPCPLRGSVSDSSSSVSAAHAGRCPSASRVSGGCVRPAGELSSPPCVATSPAVESDSGALVPASTPPLAHAVPAASGLRTPVVWCHAFSPATERHWGAIDGRLASIPVIYRYEWRLHLDWAIKSIIKIA